MKTQKFRRSAVIDPTEALAISEESQKYAAADRRDNAQGGVQAGETVEIGKPDLEKLNDLGDLEKAALRTSRGEPTAFEDVVAATSPKLVRLAARILGNADEAEDVVQESYVKAYQSLVAGRFNHEASVSTWLYRIVSNRAIDALRSRARRPTLTSAEPTGTWDGLASVEARLALSELDDWLGNLPAQQRAALVLKSVEGLTTAEVADNLGCTEGAAEQKLVRARATLRQQRGCDDRT